jgi:hypothetical protein
MNFDNYCRSELERYPEYVTQKEMGNILGICISKAYTIQKKGLVPFEYVNTENGRKQQIKTRDILSYKYSVILFNKSESEYVDGLRSYYKGLVQLLPNVLLVSDIMSFTGYSKTTINNWVSKDKLKSLTYKGKKIQSFHRGKGSLITKDALLDFLTSTYYRSIARKSSIHREQAAQYEKLFIKILQKRGIENV